MPPSSLPSLLVVSLVAGCMVVDDSLYKKRPLGAPDAEPALPTTSEIVPAPTGEPDAEVSEVSSELDAASSVAVDAEVDAAPLAYTDTCHTRSGPVLTETASIAIDTRALADDFNDTVSCTGYKSPGHDAFLRIRTDVHDRWHFHMRANGESTDPVLYLTQNCDPRSCAHFSDSCAAGADEHFSFVPHAKGEWFVGIDDRKPGGALYRVEALRTTCGDSKPEHGEACDDGNHVNGDGCDDYCRKELAAPNALELEPNDEPTFANMLAVSSGAARVITVAGRLGGCPVVDRFGVRVAHGESIRAVLVDPRSSDQCTFPSAHMLKLSLVRPDGAALGQATQGLRNECLEIEPEIDAPYARQLTEGLYFLVLEGASSTDIPYQLRVEIEPLM